MLDYLVTNNNDTGPGSLRQACLQSDKTRIKFAIDNTQIHLNTAIIPFYPFELDGQGKNITITGRGFNYCVGDSPFLFKNLYFRDIHGTSYNDAPDCIMSGSPDGRKGHVIVSNCDFDNKDVKDKSTVDEFASAIFGSKLEIYYCRIKNTAKVCLAGNGDAPREVDKDIQLIMAFNLIEKVERRIPYLRYGRAHVYNNIINGWEFKSSPFSFFSKGKSFCARSSSYGQLLFTYNVLKQECSRFNGFPANFVAMKFKLGATLGAWAEKEGIVQAHGNWVKQSWVKVADNGKVDFFIAPNIVHFDKGESLIPEDTNLLNSNRTLKVFADETLLTIHINNLAGVR